MTDKTHHSAPQKDQPEDGLIVAHETESISRPLREAQIISARKCGVKCQPFLCDAMDFLADPGCVPELQKGNAYFFFACKIGTLLDEDERFVINQIINLTSFKNEVVENNVPIFDAFDDEDAAKYTVILTKATYLLPGITIAQLTPQLICTTEYQKNCQPENSTIESNVPDDTTIRFSKTVIKFIYNMTVQLKMSKIDAGRHASLSQLDRIKVEQGLLLERTKRQVTKVDGTAKAKSVLLYTPVDGGVLVTNITVAINTSIPTIVAGILNNFGATGAREVSETAERTRKYIAKKFGKK
jgi:hypothetical protein